MSYNIWKLVMELIIMSAKRLKLSSYERKLQNSEKAKKHFWKMMKKFRKTKKNYNSIKCAKPKLSVLFKFILEFNVSVDKGRFWKSSFMGKCCNEKKIEEFFSMINKYEDDHHITLNDKLDYLCCM